MALLSQLKRIRVHMYIKALNSFLANFLEAYFAGLSAYNEVFFQDYQDSRVHDKRVYFIITFEAYMLRSSLSR